MGTFERFLTVWVLLCIVAGIGLGQLAPGAFHAIGAATVAQVNLPVATLIWLMLLKIDLGSLRQVGGCNSSTHRRTFRLMWCGGRWERVAASRWRHCPRQ